MTQPATSVGPAVTAGAATGPSQGHRRSWRLDLVVVLLATGVVIWGLNPVELLSDRLPWAGDHVGHVVVPWWLAAEGGGPRGWTDWAFAGFPVNVLYPPLPSIVTAAAAGILPFAVAYKIVMVIGVVLLPAAAYLAARWGALSRPAGPLAAAVATVPFLFDTGCSECGATVISTLSGETAHSIGVTAALLALGAVDRLCRAGRGTIVAVVTSAVAAISHPVSALWLLLGVGLVIALRAPWRDRARLVRTSAAAVVAVLLAAWWWVPFLALRSWMSRLEIPRTDDYLGLLFPASALWEICLTGTALVGAIILIRRGGRFAIVLAALTVVSASAFVVLPTGQLENTRVLPGWHLGRWLFFGLGVVELGRLGLQRSGAHCRQRWVSSASVVILVATTATLGLTRGWFLVDEPARGLEAGSSLIPGVAIDPFSWASLAVLRGYEARPEYPDLVAVKAMIRQVGRDNGCGRMSWDQVRLPTTLADPPSPFGGDQVLLQSALWTDGCVVSIAGILTDSSATASDVQQAMELTSQDPYRYLREVPQLPYEPGYGIERLRELGVRYYLTHGGVPAAEARRDDRLSLAGSAGRFEVWEIRDWAYVEPLTTLPVVAGVDVTTSEWIDLSVAFQSSNSQGAVLLAQSGPPRWPTSSQLAGTTATELPSVTVSDVQVRDGRVSFGVDRTGVPVLVRVSAFPGWTAQGADGPFRVTPNFMVVVPTDSDVVMIRRSSAAEVTGDVIGSVGVIGLVLLLVAGVPAVRRRIAAGGADE